jgi:succinate dehydrogenase/fumarate reductase cytochrome b subunit
MRLFSFGHLGKRGKLGVRKLIIDIGNPFSFRKTGYFRSLHIFCIRIIWAVNRKEA